MRTTKCEVLLVLLVGAVAAHSTCEEDLQQELERERKEDADKHGCRACNTIKVEADPNCPPKGYDCDESLQLTSKAPTLNSCDCAQLRCADANATLAVDGELVRKVSCKDHKWTSQLGEAESAVCAKACGLGICLPFPALDPWAEMFFAPLAVRPPDGDHRCAWADCQYGAGVKNDAEEKIYKGTASFACTGNRAWKYAGPKEERRNLIWAACIKSDCKTLPFSDDNPLCKTKYSCSQPSFVEIDNDFAWGTMTCPSGGALQFTANNSVVDPICTIGQWFVGSGGHISPETQVMCANCAAVRKEASDAEQPDDSNIKTGVICKDGQLTIEYGADKKQAPVETMVCSTNFEWVTAGGTFTGFNSMDELVSSGTEWKVRCIPKECKTLPFTKLHEVCTKSYSCEAANYDGTKDDGKMSCTDANALRRDSDNTEIDASCTNGQWTTGENPISSDSAVRCINCPDVATVPTENGVPVVTARNKEVNCLSGGKLAIEYSTGGVSKDTQVGTLTCSQTFEWVATGGNFDPFTSLADAVKKGATWKAKCVTKPSKVCETLPFGHDNAVCQTKYTCLKADYVSGAMNCIKGSLRLDLDDTPAALDCENGEWEADGNPIPSDTKVRCITCPEPKTEATENPAPTNMNNEEVICNKGGQLTVAYAIGGAPGKETRVNNLKCSPTFEWDTEGGDFESFSSLAGAVKQGATWTAKCVTEAVKPCQALPTSITEPYCTKDGPTTTPQTSDNLKYLCIEMKYANDGDPMQGRMECSGGGRPRSIKDHLTAIQPTCLNGLWTDDLLNAGIPDTTTVTCVSCRPINKMLNDPEQIKMELTANGFSISCLTKQLVMELLTRDTLTVERRAKLSSFICNKASQMWEASGDPLTPYNTFVELLEANQLWVLRCDGER